MEKYTDDDFNLRLANNSSILNAKKKPDKKKSNIEKNDLDNRYFWELVANDKCELEGPYECPLCGGHVMLDASFLDQVELVVTCPYCGQSVYVLEDTK